MLRPLSSGRHPAMLVRAMNYRHAFHAGNFADVFKHAVIARILVHLREKPAAFRVIDTHAGAGLYDLFGAEARRTEEWRAGIGRLLAAPLPPAIRGLLAPYLEAVSSVNAGTELRRYPGSPLLSLSLMRRQDRLIACELEPKAAALLVRDVAIDLRAKVVAIDGWTALNAYVPPKERRGLVIVDPSFEDPYEFSRLAQCLEGAYRKWPTGCYVLWYPIKARREPDALAKRIARAGIAKMLRAELLLAPQDPDRLTGAGLIIINPPWMLEAELKQLLPSLASGLGQSGSGYTLDWLAGEK
jgi:23S rRNA (adenine2030-N6)-methyltransferase